MTQEQPTFIFVDGCPNVASAVLGGEATHEDIPLGTCQEGEYKSVLLGIRLAKQADPKFGLHFVILCDNANVVLQIIGKNKIKEPRLKILAEQARAEVLQALPHGKVITFEWMSGKNNPAHKMRESYLKEKTKKYGVA